MIAIIWTAIKALAGAWASKIWAWTRQPHGLYIVAGITAALVLWWWSGHEYAAGRAAATAELQPKITAALSARDQARANTETMQSALDRQNAAIASTGEQTYALLKLQAAVVARDGQIADLKSQIAAYLAAPPQGATELERWQDADSRALKIIRGEDK